MDRAEVLKIIQQAKEDNRTELDLSGKGLTELSAEIGQLTSLTVLNLRDNQMTTLPAEIGQLTNLTWLDLSCNKLNAVPPEIGKLTSLTTLGLHFNQLTALPAEIGQLTNLTYLTLSSNQLAALPPEIVQLTNLTWLLLSSNQLAALPPEIGQLTNLTRLDLDGTQLTALPPEIGQLTNLTSLALARNQLTALPPEIGQLTNLTELYLWQNQLTVLPAEIGRLTKLTCLFLINNQLTALPPEIGQFTKLPILDLSHNQLTDLPAEIGQLTNLHILDLSHNQLTDLPAEIGQLTNLTSLDLGHNQLTDLPQEIFQFTKLTNLYLDHNQLTDLPQEIFQFTKLTGLYLSHNQLTALPQEIRQLTNLTSLYLRGTQLTALPVEIGQLTNLTTLNLVDNQLTSLPVEIVELSGLFSPPPEGAPSYEQRGLFIYNNPFSDLPPEIVKQGKDAILAYLRELHAGCQREWTAKMVLVGEGGVGKTCLLRSLRGEAYVDSPTTRGIEIHSLELPHPAQEGVRLTLNAWDFGGQEIYHATHQFFLTNRALFILVWNARHGFKQGNLYTWLDAIQARAPDSPVMVVAAWTDERDADLPNSDLQRRYPQIAGFYSISNKTGQGIAELREAVAQVAARRLPLMGEKWPATWLAAAQAIRAREEKHITPQELWAMMSAHHVPEAGRQKLASWLHELGDILFFREQNELNDLVILKPQWVTQYIGKVLESEEVIRRAGIFTDRQMDVLWSDLAPAMRLHFLRLMETFDLSYRTQEKVSLVVERLPLDPPDYQAVWNKNMGDGAQREISMKFKLNAMQPGIPTWFIARSHRFTTNTHWRLGAVFAYEPEQKHLALVQAFPHECCIQLTVRGPSPHNFFALLKDGLEETLARYPGLKIERTIPCPGHADQPCTYEFNYESLQKAIEREKPVEAVQCQVTYENVSVAQLLFGLHLRTHDRVLEKIEELQSQVTLIQKDSDIHHDELVTLLQREYTKTYRREQSQLETYCPNVFVLRPHASRTWQKILGGSKLELQLYCQASGCWHPTQEGGLYTFDYHPEWLQYVGTHIKKIVPLLSAMAPRIGPWINLNISDYATILNRDVELMKELAKQLPEIKEISDRKDGDSLEGKFGPSADMHVEGAALRVVRQLLEKLDAQHVWGGLQRILTPEGDYLWLCEYHAREYKS